MFAFLAGDFDVLLDVGIEFEAVLDFEAIRVFEGLGFLTGRVGLDFVGVRVDCQGFLPVEDEHDAFDVEDEADWEVVVVLAAFALSEH